MSLNDFFTRHPVFTRSELDAYRAEAGHSADSTDSLLTYHVRHSHLVRVRRGLYAAVAAGEDPETVAVDPFLVAAKMAPDAVLGYHTALELYGFAYSVHFRFVALSGHRVRPFTFRGHRFRAVDHPKPLRDTGQQALGVHALERAGLDVEVTTLERTVVDVLHRPELAGGLEEVWRSLDLVAMLRLDELVGYALRLDNATTAAKLGLFLEQHQDELFVADEQLERLRRHAPSQPHYVERQTARPMRLVSRWNLVVPEDLATADWIRAVP